MAPVVPGYCSTTANGLAAPMAATSPGATSTRVMPTGAARVASTARVCGCRSVQTHRVSDPVRPTPCAIVMASAAAVASSSRDALAMPMPVRSQIIVW